MHPRVWPQSHAQDPLLWSACPQKDRVNGICRRQAAHITKRDAHVVRSSLFLNFIQDLECHLLRHVNPRTGRRTKAKLKLTSGDPREDFPPESRSQKKDDAQGYEQIDSDYHPPVRCNRFEQSAKPLSNSNEPPLLCLLFFLGMLPKDPNRGDRHERTGKEVRGQHRKTDREREGHKQ